MSVQSAEEDTQRKRNKMDFNNLQKKVLNNGAREKGHASWESMKICLNESHAKFVEEIVLLCLKECLQIKEKQRTLSY